MNKQTKTIIVSAIILIVLAVAALAAWKFLSPQASEGTKTVTLEITHSDGSVKEQTLQTDADTLYGLLTENGLAKGIDGDYGIWLTSVDGETADDSAGEYWIYTKGGEQVNFSVDKEYITDGSHYEFFIYIYE